MTRSLFLATVFSFGLLAARPGHAAVILAKSCAKAMLHLRGQNEFEVYTSNERHRYKGIWSENFVKMVAAVNHLLPSPKDEREEQPDTGIALGEQYESVNQTVLRIRRLIAQRFPGIGLAIKAKTVAMGRFYLQEHVELEPEIEKVKAIKLADLRPALGQIKILLTTDWTLTAGPLQIYLVKADEGSTFTVVDMNNPNVDFEVKFEDLFNVNESIVPAFYFPSRFYGLAPTAVVTVFVAR